MARLSNFISGLDEKEKENENWIGCSALGFPVTQAFKTLLFINIIIIIISDLQNVNSRSPDWHEYRGKERR